MARLRWFWTEWGIPLLLGVPLAALIIWLGDAGTWLYLGLVATFFAGFGWVVSTGMAPLPRVALVGGMGLFAFVWPPSFMAVAEGPTPEGALGQVLRVVTVSPALGGMALLLARGRRGWESRRAAWLLLFVGLALLVPFAWAGTPWRFVLPAVGVGLLLAGARRAAPPPPLPAPTPPTWTVVIDERGARTLLDALVFEDVSWEALEGVAVYTTGDGDVLWLLESADAEVAVPADVAERSGLRVRLERLPGFDAAAVTAAMDAADEATVPCWRGEPGRGRVCAEDPITPVETPS